MQNPFKDSQLALVGIQASLKAGEILRQGFGSTFEIQSKTGCQDLVTEYDRSAEKVIIEYIQSHFPDHGFLAEESGSSTDNQTEVLWIIDPLDGTMNFAHNIPIFAVSIAAFVQKEVELGIIYQPINDELFIALKGQGAYLNGKKIIVSAVKEMGSAVAATGFPYNLDERRESTKQFNKMLEVGNPIRILGSAAITLAYIAAGRFDCYWASNLSPWDVAAGKLIIEEAQGSLTHFNGSTHTIFDEGTTVASNTHLHKELLKKLNSDRAPIS